MYQTSVGISAAAYVILEFLLVLRAVQQKPSCTRIADAVAEHQVQPPCHLVDEVVGVAFEATVIVAGEQKPLAVIDEYPAGEMDGADAGDPAAIEDVARGVVEQPQEEGHRPAAEPSGLHHPEGAERVRHVAILDGGERSDGGGRGRRRDLGVRRLARSKLDGIDRRVEEQDRREQQKRDRNPDEMRRVPHPPDERGRSRRGQAHRPVRLPTGGMSDQALPHLLRRGRRKRRPVGLGVGDQRVAQRVLLVDLANRAPDPVDVHGGRRLVMVLHPAQRIVAGLEIGAERKEPPQTGFRARRELGEEGIGRPVAIAQKGKRRRIGGERVMVRRRIVQRQVFED